MKYAKPHKPVIIGITGRAGAGKDTVAIMLERAIYAVTGQSVESYSLAAALKEGVHGMFKLPHRYMHMRELKEELAPGYFMSPREILQKFASAMRKEFSDEIFTQILEAEITNDLRYRADVAIVTDIRYQNEAKWLLGRPCSVLVAIDRPGDECRTKHHHASEEGIDFQDLLSSDRIFHIINDGDELHLEGLVSRLVTTLY